MKRLVLGIAVGALLATPCWAADGQAVYAKKCATCHSIAGKGGPMAKFGGPLDGVGGKRDKAYLDAWLKNPKAKKAKAKMPVPKIDDTERAAVVDYLLTLK